MKKQIGSRLPELYFDTCGQKESRVMLTDHNGYHTRVVSASGTKSQSLLPAIAAAVAKSNTETGELRSIRIKPGPGSFTGIRVGVTVGRILSLLLGIPVNRKDATADIKIIYRTDKFA